MKHMKTTTAADAAKQIGCSEKALPSWLTALGMRVECTRCHGSGKFSFNQISGDVCFGCNGRGKTLPKLDSKTVSEAAARVAAGEMVPVLARWRAQNAAKASVAGLVREGKSIYATIGAAYEAEYVRDRADGERMSVAVRAAQTVNNALFWDALCGLESAVQWRERTDYVAVAKEARRIVAALRFLRMAWLEWESESASAKAA